MSDLYHYGTPRHSGRYPWGSGKNPQRNKNFLQRANELKKQGFSQKEIANAFGMSTKEYREKWKLASNERDKALLAQALRLKEKGYSNVEIGKRIGKNESYVRSILNPSRQERIDSTTRLANVLKDQLKEHPYLDVGKGVELQLGGISSTQLKNALALLKEEGYNIHSFNVPQVSNPNQKTEMLVLTEGDISYKDVRTNQEKISSPEGIYFDDYGSMLINCKNYKPINLDSKRISIRYAEDGGDLQDGVIELRPGVEDISLGGNRYAQVRIAVDGTHYLKGMAMYANDLPEGIDIRFNTNKSKGTPMLGDKNDESVLKLLKDDSSNPFGAVTRPRIIGTDENGNGIQHPTSVINIVNDDEDWSKWSKTLSSQFLSKQRPELAKRQLNLYFKQKEQQFDEIMALTNPTIKRKLLEDFSDGCDSASVHLKAAALPRQGTFAILPFNDLKETEVYAPKYNDGEEVILIRYPHAGKFEIPKLKVNNNGENAKVARNILGNAEHAIGINAKVAKLLSGADFDGDTVVLIPTKNQKLASSSDLRMDSPLRSLRDFDPSKAYPKVPGAPDVGKKSGFDKQLQMGKVSNLITDMTIRGASDSEIARAVRHSMVVIDAEKHNLNWRQSYIDNGISELKEKYQGGSDRGASTLISKASSEEHIPERKQAYRPDPETGEKIFTYTNRTYEKLKKVKDKDGNYVYNDNGKIKKVGTGKYVKAMTTSTKMAETKDAYELSSGTAIENVYAEHANKLKALANRARKEMVATPRLKRSPSAAKTYEKEVKTLKAKLNLALKNAPLERQAQLIANKMVSIQREANPSIWGDKDKEKKLRANAIVNARSRVKANRRTIDISDKEWEAIQSGAISDSMLSSILRYTDTDSLVKRATPTKRTVAINSSTLARAKTWLNAGFTQAEVAENLGISISALSKALKEGV